MSDQNPRKKSLPVMRSPEEQLYLKGLPDDLIKGSLGGGKASIMALREALALEQKKPKKVGDK